MRRFSLLLAFAFAWPLAAHAQTPVGGEFQVSTFTN